MTSSRFRPIFAVAAGAFLGAAGSTIPVVAPSDTTAPFQGDRGRVIFDPACRDYDVLTLPANAACAARVAAGETAPSIAVAAQSVGLDPVRRVEALAILERTITRENHPAAHYLLGSLLATGEAFRADPVRAVKHLTIASDHGNPAAADLLASLVVAGKGTARDMSRAVRLYEQAAAGGWPTAATSLAVLYLQGRLLPLDTARGIALLKAAAAAGDKRAAQLVPLAEAGDKINNFQIIPAAADADVKARRYGTFDNPDIPPGFGFDEKLQAVHAAPYDDAATLAALERDRAQLTTPYVYELARRLAVSAPDRALRLYLLARIRMSYDALRCSDPAALDAVGAWDRLIRADLGSALNAATADMRNAAARAALADEAVLDGRTRPWWVWRSGMAAMSAAIAGKPLPLALKPAREWPELRAKARQPVEALASAAPQ